MRRQWSVRSGVRDTLRVVVRLQTPLRVWLVLGTGTKTPARCSDWNGMYTDKVVSSPRITDGRNFNSVVCFLLSGALSLKKQCCKRTTTRNVSRRHCAHSTASAQLRKLIIEKCNIPNSVFPLCRTDASLLLGC